MDPASALDKNEYFNQLLSKLITPNSENDIQSGIDVVEYIQQNKISEDQIISLLTRVLNLMTSSSEKHENIAINIMFKFRYCEYFTDHVTLPGYFIVSVIELIEGVDAQQRKIALVILSMMAREAKIPCEYAVRISDLIVPLFNRLKTDIQQGAMGTIMCSLIAKFQFSAIQINHLLDIFVDLFAAAINNTEHFQVIRLVLIRLALKVQSNKVTIADPLHSKIVDLSSSSGDMRFILRLLERNTNNEPPRHSCTP